jgi:hypothetical protein
MIGNFSGGIQWDHVLLTFDDKLSVSRKNLTHFAANPNVCVAVQ